MRELLIACAAVITVTVVGLFVYHLAARRVPAPPPAAHDPSWPSWLVDTEEWSVPDPDDDNGTEKQ